MLVAAATCAVAVTAGAVWATGSGAQAAAPSLVWRDMRIGTASGVLALPPHPRALAIVIHGGGARVTYRAVDRNGNASAAYRIVAP